ncbi:MAG TPA: aminotransferase class V-fold PLP-dependent enzyme, partial [Pseudonocardiaceae bacterium]|nr:aminotransferase class V-fold PLP-dependent enzyme [Pseudonocardiaceae bacterium]
MSERTWGFRTRALHAGGAPDPATGARAVPIYQTTSFVFEDSADAANLFALQKYGNIYSRIGNPTVAAFEERIASLEGAIGGVAAASGQAAEFLTFSCLVESGEHIVSSSGLYGGTVTQLDGTLRRFGVDTTFVAEDGVDAFAAAIRPNTKLIYTEVVGNPNGRIADLAGLAELAKSHGIPLVVDSTTATPYLCRPIEHGADIVLHSATKFLGGHGTVIGGVVVDGGKFEWSKNADKFPGLTQPDPSYHGAVYTAAVGDGLAYIIKARVQLLRDLGSAIAPASAWQLIQGIETLSLRVERHVQNAQEIAEYLENHPDVASVNYSGLPTSPWYAAANKYAPKGVGAVL